MFFFFCSIVGPTSMLKYVKFVYLYDLPADFFKPFFSFHCHFLSRLAVGVRNGSQFLWLL